jgi:hypothetical protein
VCAFEFFLFFVLFYYYYYYSSDLRRIGRGLATAAARIAAARASGVFVPRPAPQQCAWCAVRDRCAHAARGGFQV